MQQSKIKVLVVDDNRDFCEILSEFINIQPDMEVIAVTHDGDTALNSILQEKPDVVLLDIIMPKSDGINVLENFNSVSIDQKTIFIIMSAVEEHKIIQKSLDLGAKFYVIKPINIELLVQRIKDIMPSNIDRYANSNSELNIVIPKPGYTQIELEISNILCSFGIPTSQKGYYFIKNALLKLLKDKEVSEMPQKGIYIKIAQEHNTTVSAVDNSMRRSIGRAWIYRSDIFKHIFYDPTYNTLAKPTNTEFLYNTANYLELKLKKD